MSDLETQNLTLAYGETTVIRDLNLRIPVGEITVLIGPNGSGKSTLLRSLARLLKPRSGAVLLDGRFISHVSTTEVARHLSILPQGPVAPEGLTVLELVKQGRYPYQNWLRQWAEEDERMVNWALDVTRLRELAERPVDSLSGGQRQRAWIAMVLAQGTGIILLDEPTTYLDLNHQIEILDLLFELNEQAGRTIVMVLHDLNLAFRYADHIVAVQNEGVLAQGRPEEIVTPELIQQLFGMACRVTMDPMFGTPLCLPYGKGRKVREKHRSRSGTGVLN